MNISSRVSVPNLRRLSSRKVWRYVLRYSIKGFDWESILLSVNSKRKRSLHLSRPPEFLSLLAFVCHVFVFLPLLANLFCLLDLKYLEQPSSYLKKN